MDEHSIFYYPYASFKDDQLPLLKAAALYFDKLYILDPTQASSETIGTSLRVNESVSRLEQEKILQRIAPTDVFSHKEYSEVIDKEIIADLNDAEFVNLCQSSTDKRTWRLALAKVPERLRNDPKFKPLDESMRDMLSVYGFRERYYEESYYEEGVAPDIEGGPIEFRYGTYPLEIGESIMLNHAIFTGLLYSEATPITDEKFHKKMFDYKINRALQDPGIRNLIKSDRYDRIKQDKIAKELLVNLKLAIISPELPMECILEFRDDNKDKLDKAREELSWLADEMRMTPYTKEFADSIKHNILPQRIRPMLQDCEKARDKWLKNNKRRWLDAAELTVTTAAATIPIAFSPLPQVAIPLFLLSVALTAGRRLISRFRGSRDEEINGLQYFFDIANIER